MFKTENAEHRSPRFTYPGVELGATLELEYEVKVDDRTHSWWWDVQCEIPVLHSTFELRLNRIPNVQLRAGSYSWVPFSQYCETLPEGRPGQDLVRSYTCSRVPATEEEALAPPAWARVIGISWSGSPPSAVK